MTYNLYCIVCDSIDIECLLEYDWILSILQWIYEYITEKGYNLIHEAIEILCDYKWVGFEIQIPKEMRGRNEIKNYVYILFC